MPPFLPRLNTIDTFPSPMKLFFILVALVLPAFPAFSQWSIVSTTAEPMAEQTSKESHDFWLHITLRNDSNRELFIWGQRGFHLVEAFIKDPQSKVWERKNIVICGSAGGLSWQSVKAGEEIKLLRREASRDTGRSMMLTFRMAYAPDTSRDSGAEILLGDFIIPAIPKTK